ncbi:uncharacterized protein LOC134202112 [Armigeres subalbatus]|uniref:uncharacterized protein LOC134202112 n=1 Tax=Armigeres subalbatus TaxID=124917 RepID=UPI002ED3BCD2
MGHSGRRNSVNAGQQVNSFVLMDDRIVDVISLEKTYSSRTVKCLSKLICLCWISDTELAGGLDDGHLMMFNVDDGDEETMNHELKQNLHNKHPVPADLHVDYGGG